jgi:hypothetical protein
MLNRTQVFNTIENLPDQFSIDQLIDQLIFIEKVGTGLYQSKTGNVKNKEQTKLKLSKWLK